MQIETFVLFRNLAFFFATAMLIKYFIFLVLAPFYEVKEAYRKLRIVKMRGKSKQCITPNYMVSIIIPAWNEEVGILKTIRSVLANTYQNYEVIVVNDGSTDNSDKIIKSFLAKNPEATKNVRYFYKQNGGKGKALNYGVTKSVGDIIFTVDADSVIQPDAINNLVKYFYDTNIDAVVGNVIVAANPSIVSLLQQLEYRFGFYFKRAHAVMNAEYIFGGACSAYRRSAIFEELGLFDTENKTEDIEMSMRIRFFGKNCAYAEDVVCYTEGASNVNSLVNQRLRWKKGRFDTFLKYRRLFYSMNKQHNWFLSFFILPFSLLSELQLFFEPISLTLLVAYSFVTNDYVSLMLSSMFVFVVYLVTSLFSNRRVEWRILYLFIFTWPMFYFLVWIEYVALIRSLQMVIRGEEVEWQNWQRQGVGALEG